MTFDVQPGILVVRDNRKLVDDGSSGAVGSRTSVICDASSVDSPPAKLLRMGESVSLFGSSKHRFFVGDS